jgi:hypothetical protein
MPSWVQLALALGMTGALVGFDQPALLAIGAVAGVWPDFLTRLLAPLLPWPDLQITPDPASPDGTTVADGLRQAARCAREAGKAWHLRLNPVCVAPHRFAPYELDFDPKGVSLVRVAGRVTPILWHGWLPRHPLPLRVTDRPVDVRLRPQADGRLSGEILPEGHPAGHSWLMLPLLASGAALFSLKAAFVATLVAALHLALDSAGPAMLTPFWPLSKRIRPGLRSWNGTAGGRAPTPRHQGA